MKIKKNKLVGTKMNNKILKAIAVSSLISLSGVAQSAPQYFMTVHIKGVTAPPAPAATCSDVFSGMLIQNASNTLNVDPAVWGGSFDPLPDTASVPTGVDGTYYYTGGQLKNPTGSYGYFRADFSHGSIIYINGNLSVMDFAALGTGTWVINGDLTIENDATWGAMTSGIGASAIYVMGNIYINQQTVEVFQSSIVADGTIIDNSAGGSRSYAEPTAKYPTLDAEGLCTP